MNTGPPMTPPVSLKRLLATRTITTMAAIAKAITGLRVSQEVEYEGLDLGEHGERAYNY